MTWGVFPGQEVMQPTVVDHQAFEIWKNEVFKVFMETWATIYKARTDKDKSEIPADEESIAFLQKCHDSLFLVNVVDNDFIGGDLNAIMEEFI